MSNIIFEYQGEFKITVEQNDIDNFTVTYGKQVQRNLNYTEAFEALGSAIFHDRACAGLIKTEE